MTSAATLDEEGLQRLLEGLGDPAALRHFILHFVDLLGPRLRRLRRSLSQHDIAAWDDATLSLASASAMAGATSLASAATAVRQEAPPDPRDPFWQCRQRQDVALDQVFAAADDTVRLLLQYVDSLGPDTD